MKRLVVGLSAFLALAAVPAIAADYCMMANDICPVAPNDLEQCHQACLASYMVQAAFCSRLPAPFNVLCHGENSISLSQCMREC